MALTKKQKFYGFLLSSAVTSFAWDYLSTSEKPAAAATDLLIHATATPAVGIAVPSVSAAPEMPPPSAIAARLNRIASAEHLNPENVDSAFALGPGWVPEKPPALTGLNKIESVVAVEPTKEFARRHRLDAVMVRPRGGYAIVDGVGVFIGQNVEHFRLVSVAQNSAMFIWNDQRVELKIVRAGELTIDGSVISNQMVPSDPEVAPATAGALH